MKKGIISQNVLKLLFDVKNMKKSLKSWIVLLLWSLLTNGCWNFSLRTYWWIMDVLFADSCHLAGGWSGEWFESGVPGTISITSNSSGASIQHKGHCVKKIKHSNSQFIFQSHREGENWLKVQSWSEYVGMLSILWSTFATVLQEMCCK